MKIEIKLAPGAVLPFNDSKRTDAGYDLYNLEEDSGLFGGERKLFDTGVSMSIPEGYYGQILDRSGNAWKKGLHVLAGVIDSGYLGNIKVLLVNLSGSEQIIKKGDKIAQIVFKIYEKIEWEEVAELGATARAVNGFGSSGN